MIDIVGHFSIGFELALQIGLPVVLIGMAFKLIHLWN